MPCWISGLIRAFCSRARRDASRLAHVRLRNVAAHPVAVVLEDGERERLDLTAVPA